MNTEVPDGCIEAYVAALFWDGLLRKGANPLVSEEQARTFSGLLLRYVAHVMTDSGSHLGGVCDTPSFYTKTLPCEDDRRSLLHPQTVGFWIRLGNSFTVLRDICTRAGFDSELAFPHSVRMCISIGCVEIRISDEHPFWTLYQA